MRDPYKVLGVTRDAGADEIKAAWRHMAKAVHPDHNQGDPTATARFAEIGRAYETLKDPKKRNLFDNALRMAEAKKQEQTIMQQRQAAREAAARAKAAQANAERVMEELARANAYAQKAAAAGAKQQQASTTEAAEEMVERIFGAQTARAAGAQSQAQSQQQAQAKPHTDESAKQPEQETTESEPAKAEDEHMEASAAGGSNMSLPLSLLTSLVRRFTGAGQPGLEKAPDEVATATVTIEDIMKGSWTTVSLPEGREVGFALPAGTTEGHQIRLKGQGFKLPGMQRGDAVINIHIAPDPRFTVNGFDVHAVLPLNIENAVLGTEARIDGPQGPVNVTVPAWSGSDKTIRIPDKGLPNDNGGKGDLVVELRIMLWEKPDDKVTDLMRSMREGLFL
ncbi:DnaJ-class molecular chaperone [Rhizobium sp. BK529]|uniref:J domain-containing protein n=1 Tax=unclassified Rhizobium TaxID=2613769 RepID=UPI001051B93C|nr:MULTISPECIES: DnaJ C-terminal domain-containing protein [unclassified Rhizobium]MBB3592241.1 DnaJ-class molecular chaperone [Rhizobium sp. BK529]TCS06662.1 DnaJ-like protein [Rhizobium sp. BK418]